MITAAKRSGLLESVDTSTDELGGLGFSADLNRLRKDNARLQRDLANALEERNRLLRKSREESTSKKERGSKVLEKRLDTLRAELDESRRERESLLRTNAELGKKSEFLDGRLRELLELPSLFLSRLEEITRVLETPEDSDAERDALAERDTDRLLDRFNQTIESLWQLVDERHVLQNRLLRDEIAGLKGTRESHLNIIGELRQEIEGLTGQFAGLQASLEDARSNIQLRDNRLSDLRGQVDDLEAANKKLSESNLELKSRVKDLRGCVDPDLFQQMMGPSNHRADLTLDAGTRRHSPWLSAAAGAVFGCCAALGVNWLYQGEAPLLLNIRDFGELAPEDLFTSTPMPLEGQADISEPSGVRAGSEISDHLLAGGSGPALVYLPGGIFTMGTDRHWVPDNEKPARTERVANFYISKYEVTFDAYDRFARATGRALPADEGWGRGNRPVINVSWADATAYAKWLSAETGRHYRLPTEAEWEYGMAGGFQGIYWWGNGFESGREVCFNCGTRWDGKRTAPVGSAALNPLGLYDMGGNVMEWAGDCGNTPSSGVDCSLRVARGGAFNKPDDALRTTARRALQANIGYPMVGFRVLREP